MEVSGYGYGYGYDGNSKAYIRKKNTNKNYFKRIKSLFTKENESTKTKLENVFLIQPQVLR